MKLNLALQFNPASKFYIIPHFNIAAIGFGNFKDYYEDFLFSNGYWTEGIISTLISPGTSFSYNSILGPVNFDVSWVNDINKTRLFFSIRLPLN